MGVQLNLTDITSGFLSAAQHTANNTLIETALNKALDRTSSTNNAMEVDIDMGVNALINASNVSTSKITLSGQEFTSRDDLIGPVGPQGEQGIQGIQGVQGIQGLVGPQGQSFSPDSSGTYEDIFSLGSVADDAAVLVTEWFPPQVVNTGVNEITVRVFDPHGAIGGTAYRAYIEPLNGATQPYFPTVKDYINAAGSTEIGAQAANYVDFVFSGLSAPYLNDHAHIGVAYTDGTGFTDYNLYDLKVTDYVSSLAGGGSLTAPTTEAYVFIKRGAQTVPVNSVTEWTVNGNEFVPSRGVWETPLVFGGTGPQGIQGDQGPQGIQGIQGIQGPQGIQGETGPAGESLDTSGTYPNLRAQATTKGDVGLGNVANYTVTSSVSDSSATKYATASAVKTAYDEANKATNRTTLFTGSTTGDLSLSEAYTNFRYIVIVAGETDWGSSLVIETSSISKAWERSSSKYVHSVGSDGFIEILQSGSSSTYFNMGGSLRGVVTAVYGVGRL